MHTAPKVDLMTKVRTALLFTGIANQILVAFGMSPIPIEEAQVELLVSTIWTMGAAIWAWWKDNDLTVRARLNKKPAK